MLVGFELEAKNTDVRIVLLADFAVLGLEIVEGLEVVLLRCENARY